MYIICIYYIMCGPICNNNGDRVGLFLMADMTSAQGFVRASSVRLSLLVETTLTTWTWVREGLSVALNFAGGQDDNNK